MTPDSPLDSPPHRVAAYYAPRIGSPWWQAGSQWLGRCADSGQALPQPAIDGVPMPLQQALTAAPRRYGWHATLKAPFALAEDASMNALRDELATLCAQHAPFELPPLRVQRMGDFLALVPAEPSAALQAIAADCVTYLHRFAAPLSPAELARRRAGGLTAQQDAMLVRWGYPHVFAQYRFHMTLTGSLSDVDEATVARLADAAQRQFDALPPPRFEAVSLFAEAQPGADFRCLAQQGMGR